MKLESGELSIEVLAALFGMNGDRNHWSTYLIIILQRCQKTVHLIPGKLHPELTENLDVICGLEDSKDKRLYGVQCTHLWEGYEFLLFVYWA